MSMLKRLLRRSPKPSGSLRPEGEWLELWSFGRYDLRLTDEEFWELSWDEFSALTERYLKEQESRDYRAALVCWILANAHRDTRKKPKPFEIKDFMPQRRPKKAKTEEQMKDELTILNIALGGEVK